MLHKYFEPTYAPARKLRRDRKYVSAHLPVIYRAW